MTKAHNSPPTVAQPRPIDLTTALAKPKRERAREAAACLTGEAALKLTVTTLSTLFGVSANLIYQEKMAAERATASNTSIGDLDLAAAWKHASEDERAEFLSTVRSSVLTLLAPRRPTPVPQPKSPSNGHARGPQQERRSSALPTIYINS